MRGWHRSGSRRTWALPAVRQRSKYGAKATYYNGQTFHSTELDCPPPGPAACPICSTRSRANARYWYQSKSEAAQARRLDAQVERGEIAWWERGKSILLVDAPLAADRLRYRPDFDVGITSPRPKPDFRIEVKGGVGGIAYSGKMKILLYKEMVRRGEQPPLLVVDEDGQEITSFTRPARKRPTALRRVRQ